MVFTAIIIGLVGRIEICKLRSKGYQQVISEMLSFLSLIRAFCIDGLNVKCKIIHNVQETELPEDIT